MGWRADGGLWLLVRGGGLFLSKGTGVSICEGYSLLNVFIFDNYCEKILIMFMW